MAHALCHGRTQKLKNHPFKLAVRNLDASSDITEGSIFCAYYCFLHIVGFELEVILSNAVEVFIHYIC